MNTRTFLLARTLVLLLAGALAGPARAADTVALQQLPEVLHHVWDRTKPEMNPNSRCAAAFDSHSDPAKMILRCSVHMRMGAEAERRALAYCEEERTRKGVHMPCKIVRE